MAIGRTPEEVYKAKGVKPTLSPNLDTLALVEVHFLKHIVASPVMQLGLQNVLRWLFLLYTIGLTKSFAFDFNHGKT